MELTPADIRAISALHADWIARERDGLAASILEFCAEGVVFLRPDATPLVGKASIAAWLAAHQVTIQYLDITEVTVHGAGGLACLSAHYATTWLAKDGEHRAEGGHTWLLRKRDSWAVIAVAWTP